MLPPDMRLRRRVQVLLAGFLSLVVLALALDVFTLSVREDRSDELTDQLEPARVELQRLRASMLDQETGERGYLLTGDESFLEPFTSGRKDTERSLERLTTLVTNDDLTAGVQRVGSRTGAWQELGAGFEIAAKREGRDQVVESLVATGTSKALFDAVRTEIDAVDELLSGEIERAAADVDRLDSLLFIVDLATLALAVALIGAAAVLARRWVTHPLENLGSSVQSVASGSLQSTVTVEGPPELVELAADVDAMRRRILAEVEAAERAKEALAERGMIVMTLRDELAAGVPVLPQGIGHAGRFAPAGGIVAGDWFDIFRLDRDRVALALVDVSGHGAGVGAFALRTKALTLAAIESYEPGEAFAWVADRLGDTGEQFLTGVIVVLDAQRGTLRYASAGHPPLLLGGVAGITELEPTGPLVGPIRGHWTTQEVDLPRGGVIVAYSDGLIEARNAEGEPFGVARLADLVEHHQLGGPDAVADACLEAVQQWQRSSEDDLTLCVLSR
jgi:CHASE3 domain sensor protein